MKIITTILLILILLVSVAHFLLDFGILGVSYDYRAIAALEMDEIGFKKIAEKNKIEAVDGKWTFPKEMAGQLVKFNMLPYTISEVEKEGWTFVSVTSDDHYLFRKRK
jgi:hypothetical protein